MAVFEGKSTTERNKIIAAAVLGVVALIALYLAFGRGLGGSTTTVKITSSPTPKPVASTGAPRTDSVLPTVTQQDFVYQTTPVVYQPGSSFAPDPGRNIFAFYEPPPPCPTCPTPIKVTPTPTPATPTPTPIFDAKYMTPQNIYAGSQGFRLEVGGDRFTPNAHIYFNQREVATTFINAQKIVADIPANLIAQEGPRQVIVQTPDGTAYSTQMIMSVMPPPRPNVQYIGMIGRKRYNNDTAYFIENGKTAPFGARLNDVVGGRFRVIDISAAEVLFEDVSLGFKHRVPLAKATTASGAPFRPGQNDGSPVFPPGMQPNCPPGIPCNPQIIPLQPQPKRTPSKDDDVDDDGDGGGQN
ncbi:MAG: IPT/TIG domain-containing protein [Acidobacteriota bacterium]